MYQNPYTPGFEVLSKSGYSMDQSSSSASYLTTNDFPNYTAMFYSPTEHETMTSIKYGNFEQDYSNLREIQQSLNGPPIEFYIPHSFNVADGSGRNEVIQIDSEIIKNKLMDKVHEEALKEIENAQREVKGKRIKRIEVEDVLLLRKRKMTIVFEDKEQDI
ncbi:MAG: hypothetical protein IH934_08085 [Nanoarchaeota archaeon]|nr:hypothetical protein [Nanoarchaeota archaeon]